MFEKIKKYISTQAGLRHFLTKKVYSYHSVSTALAKASATSNLREINLTIPHTWEFSGFSQNRKG